jgi:hypothetical protein
VAGQALRLRGFFGHSTPASEYLDIPLEFALVKLHGRGRFYREFAMGIAVPDARGVTTAIA